MFLRCAKIKRVSNFVIELSLHSVFVLMRQSSCSWCYNACLFWISADVSIRNRVVNAICPLSLQTPLIFIFNMGLLRNVFVASLAILGANAVSAVIDLIPSNFDNVVLKSGKPSLVEFFAPWCGRRLQFL